jgi:DEAD/DEAH box helicase domain-containing protein
MQKMFGLQPNDIVAISEDGAPRNQRDFLVWSPPLIDPSQPALGKASSIAEATGLMRFLMKRGIRVILFCKVSCAILPSIDILDESYADSKGLRVGKMRL